MQNPGIVSFEDLQEMSGHKGVAAVVKYCRENDIECFFNSKRVTTTTSALNKALGIVSVDVVQDEIKI